MALLAALVALVALVGVALLVVLRDGDRRQPAAWDERVVELVAFVERERGLEFEHPVQVDFLSEEEFRTEVTARDELDEEEQAELESVEAMLRAVGLVSGDVDLLEIGDTLVGEGVVGFYSYEEQRIAVRGATLDDERRSTLVHELTHALQDQHFDLGGREHETSGETAAFTAVVEADAVLVEDAWRDTLAPAARERLEAAELEDVAGLDLEGVPEVFVELMSYPYIFGPDFLEAVIDERGAEGRDAVFTDPPASERHIILPETYLAGEAPEAVPTPPLEDGEVAIEESDDDFGMLSLLVVLAERVDFGDSWRAVLGWAGDAAIAFERDGTTCVRVDVAFDGADGARDFATAFAQWSAGLPARHEQDGDRVRFESCDPGVEVDQARAEGQVSGVQGLALRRALVAGFEEAGAPEGTAACIGDGLIDRVGANRIAEIDELLVADPDDPAVAELEDAVADLLPACS